MLLNDWQRGRIPYFVKPPPAPTPPQEQGTSHSAKLDDVSVTGDAAPKGKVEVPTSEVADGEERPEEGDAADMIAHVIQDFGGINVGPEFAEDDLLPLEPVGELTELMGTLEDGKDEKDEVAGDETCGQECDEYNLVDRDVTEKRNKPGGVIRVLDDKINKYRKFLAQAQAKRFSAIRIPKELSLKVFAQSEKRQWGAKRSMEPVSDCSGTVPIKHQKAKRDANRCFDEDMVPETKVSSKEKRRMERALKPKKTGSRYYDTHNVKNRNRNRKKISKP